MTTVLLGVRHYSPACARLVRARVRGVRPHTVLIEGPSDFNPRLAELGLPHQLPIALYSYYGDERQTRSCFAPFAEFAPEWAALQAAREVGARVRFIDLPYWHPGAQSLPQRYTLDTLPGRERYARVQALLQRQCGIDGEDALWDHLYERDADAIGVDAERTDALGLALATYFDELRADEAGHPSDQAREAHMREWVAWATATPGPVLVVCGGWHQRALQGVAPAPLGAPEPMLTPPPELSRHGSYLVPYSEVELDAYAGYGAGMPSPLWYRWQWRQGTAYAGAQTLRALVRRLRALRQPLSTAQLIQARARVLGLAALRGHPQPLRCDVLDGLLDALVDGALEEAPPWTARGAARRMDPRLREVLRALSGDGRGALAAGTPQPPLVLEVQQLLAGLGLTPPVSPLTLELDRRRPDDSLRAKVLWRLSTLSVSGFVLDGMSARGAPRQLAEDQHYLERWTLRQTPTQNAELIQAGAWGATLAEAAARRLQQRARDEGTPAAWVNAVVAALRCGFLDLGEALAQATHEALAGCGRYEELTAAARRLAALADAGFWGQSLATLLDPLLALCVQRVSWLIEGRSGGGAADPADVEAVRFLAWSRARDTDPGAEALTELLLRRALDPAAPAALRGAAAGALWQAGTRIDEDAVIATARRFASGEALGDWLIGLFALAREVVTRSPALIVALDPLIAGCSEQDFLTALPALRQAFGWFPPRERAAIAERVAELHGRGSALAAALLTLPDDVSQSARAAALQARVRASLTHWGLA